MKIFVTSDIHGNRKIMDKLSDMEFKYKVDFIFICGDIGGKSYNTNKLLEFSKLQKDD